MAKKIPEPTRFPRQRTFLVGVEIRDQHNLFSMKESLDELALLAETDGLEVVGTLTQKIQKPVVDTFIGAGKVEELGILVEENLAEVIVFDHELSPRHQRELERIFGLKVQIIDRTALILDIFAQHAHTREGALQVELAQYEYRLPRLTRAWTHLARQTGGGGGRAGSVGGVGLRGPGETQLEVDRREITRRITHLKAELEKVRDHRTQYRARRKRGTTPVVALVGYTNAGKSTLLNTLTKANVYVADQLFATLDPTTRRIQLPGKKPVLITDTVGFIQKLPTQLVAAFRATLEEIKEADLLLHVVDSTHLNAEAQARSVLETLSEIDADTIPILTVMNKVDLLEQPDLALKYLPYGHTGVAISGLTGAGIPEMLAEIERLLYQERVLVTLRIPYREGRMISLFHEHARIESIRYDQEDVILKGRILSRHEELFQDFITMRKI